MNWCLKMNKNTSKAVVNEVVLKMNRRTNKPVVDEVVLKMNGQTNKAWVDKGVEDEQANKQGDGLMNVLKMMEMTVGLQW